MSKQCKGCKKEGDYGFYGGYCQYCRQLDWKHTDWTESLRNSRAEQMEARGFYDFTEPED